MAEIPDNVEDTVLDVKAGTTRLPFRNVEADHLTRIRQGRMRLDFLMYGAQNTIVDLESHRIQLGLILEERRR